ncbi:MAG: polysaccharide deacetylase family protein [Christensenellales bacterium]|jgi:peptidoglycan/xylan/chitin deacetylase (PgdA/CDA1 family)
MKRFLALLLCLFMVLALLPVTQAEALPHFQFGSDFLIGFQGRELRFKARVDNYKKLGKPVSARLQDEEGFVVLDKTFKSSSYQTITFTVPDTWQGAKSLSWWVDGRKANTKDLILAVDNIGNRQVKRVSTRQPRMSITIDAAYGDTYTLELLSVLDEFGVKCTFFVTGNWAQAYPEHILDIQSRGHEIANHSFSHPHMTTLSFEKMQRQIVRCSDAIEAAGASRPVLFRPPYGDTNEKLRAVSRSLGCEVIMWTIDSHDWDTAYNHQKIVRRVTKDVGPGHIILFHNDGKFTPGVLREVIPYYQSLGLSLVTISTLLDEGEYSVDKEGVVSFYP